MVTVWDIAWGIFFGLLFFFLLMFIVSLVLYLIFGHQVLYFNPRTIDMFKPSSQPSFD